MSNWLGNCQKMANLLRQLVKTTRNPVVLNRGNDFKNTRNLIDFNLNCFTKKKESSGTLTLVFNCSV